VTKKLGTLPQPLANENAGFCAKCKKHKKTQKNPWNAAHPDIPDYPVSRECFPIRQLPSELGV
jgi:hypothetical protein